MDITIRNLPMFYESRGEGRPIFFLHGQPTDHTTMLRSYEPTFEKKTGWHRIYLDLPGMGKTPGADWINSTDDVVDLLGEFIDTIAPEQDFVLVGFSYGGYLARALAYKHVDSCLGLMLMAPTIKPQAERKLPEQNIIVKNPALLAEVPDPIRPIFEHAIAVQTEEVLRRSKEEIMPAVLTADHAYLARVRENFRLSYQEAMDEVTFMKPGLFLMGRQDVVTGYEDAMSLHEQYPRTSIVVLDRCGHGLQMPQKTLFEALTSEWLFRVEEMIEHEAVAIQ